MVWSNISVPVLLPSYIDDPWGKVFQIVGLIKVKPRLGFGGVEASVKRQEMFDLITSAHCEEHDSHSHINTVSQ